MSSSAHTKQFHPTSFPIVFFLFFPLTSDGRDGCTQNGRVSGQTAPRVHFHILRVVPRLFVEEVMRRKLEWRQSDVKLLIRPAICRVS
ncbi:hypothetical protein DFH94DRAFT_407682 [Russula ochroleuca]|uniref:Secreted protein n=1 Tax=Russula ochroleuca TaxID=152965 RepID=A0A9P5TAD8_9AGAM|nr:hypothetical protein DFH94DRAFT_407682 [Russula ochroleuca]